MRIVIWFVPFLPPRRFLKLKNHFEQKRRKMTKLPNSNDVSPAVRDKMKKAFAECYRAVLACEDETGRKRCELFRELPDRRVSGYSLSIHSLSVANNIKSGLSRLLSAYHSANCSISSQETRTGQLL